MAKCSRHAVCEEGSWNGRGVIIHNQPSASVNRTSRLKDYLLTLGEFRESCLQNASIGHRDLCSHGIAECMFRSRLSSPTI
eukprot:6177118-Pleurochrysis_carterae.AAC.1